MNPVTIGPATLYFGDSLEIMPTLEPVDHVIMDPPYEDDMHNSKSAYSDIRTDGYDSPPPLDFDSITDIRWKTTLLTRGLSKGWLVLFCTPEGVAAWRNDIEAAEARYKRACVWVKPDAAPQFNGQGPAMGAEMIVTAWAGTGHSRWNGGGKRGVYTHLTNPADRTKLFRDGKLVNAHPTEKPRLLMKELVNDFTNIGESVLDPFMGVGSTGVACLELGRRFIGIEKNAEYFNIAVKRLHETYERLMIQPELFERKKSKQENLFPIDKATQSV